MKSLSPNWFVWIFCFSFLIYFQPCTSDGCNASPTEENTTGSVTCEMSMAVKNLTWQLQRNGVFVDLSSCDSQGSCTNIDPHFKASPDNHVNGTVTRSLLTISAVNRNETTFKCVADGGYVAVQCTLEVYVKPETPSCRPPVATSTFQVSVSCNTSRVYPSALCLFQLLSQSNEQKINGIPTYKTTPSITSPGYFATTCTLVLNVKGINPAIYEFSLSMIPKVSTVTSAVPAGSHISVSLKAPTAGVAQDCPNGPTVNGSYIDARNGSSTTCRCELTDEGMPPGQASWISSSGATVGVMNSTDRSSSLTLTYNQNDPSPSYKCRATTVLNIASMEVQVYSPSYATGPNAVTITLSDLTFNLCPSDNQSVTVTCKVAANQVNPGTTFSVFVASQSAVLGQRGHMPSSDYTYSYTFRPQAGGNPVITCRAENSLFPDVQTNATAKLSVREPPRTAPTIRTVVNGVETPNNKNTIPEGSTVVVICLVEGGVPEVQSVTLRCGDKQDKATSNRASVSMTATKSLNGQICSCNAVHVTNCYNLASESTLFVTPGNLETSGLSNRNLIIGVVVGVGVVLIVFAVVLAVVIITCKRRKRRAQRTNRKSLGWSSKSDYLDAIDTYTISGSTRYVVPPSYPPPQPPKESDYSEIYPTSDYLVDDNEFPYRLRGADYNGVIKPDYIEAIG